ncbi:plastid movement impaired 2 [Prunus dulcis]|uniref:Plastid movement impaired 2 n=1 Tax=Prunus dulcis TaxID=3755 RepID=A0A4Y1R6B5_PRUDU|nr:hypothetical protein L3X38_018777 [Prunus dulcis]BBG99672.1 plastid movement impaired 2 [Prunus dulcis]
MGNTIGGRNKAKVMKISGETFKVKTPIRARDVVKDYPGHVLLNSEAVKHFGVRAKPLEPQQDLRPKKIYFLLQLPKFPEEEKQVPRRVRSGIQVSAKDRLECLMLSRRSVSDLTSVRAASAGSEGPVRMKVRVPRAQMVKLVEESNDDVEIAERIIELYMANNGGKVEADMAEEEGEQGVLRQRKPAGHGGIRVKDNLKPRHEKRVSFVPVEEGEIRLDTAPQ